MGSGLGGVSGGETELRMCCMREESLFNKKNKEKKMFMWSTMQGYIRILQSVTDHKFTDVICAFREENRLKTGSFQAWK